MRLPETETREILLHLTPDQVDLDLFTRIIKTMQQTAQPVPTVSMDILDCCGTGGSGITHFNTSTSAAIVLAAGGVSVLKFGNRAMSSNSGSFDFLERLGIAFEAPLDVVPEILSSCGLAFLYAPQCYPTLKSFTALRRSLGVKTIFNFIGPLLNPFQPTHRLLGVSHRKMQDLMAQYLTLQTGHASWIVHASPTIDELVCNGETRILKIKHNTTDETQYHSVFEGEKPADDLKLTSEDNVRTFERMLSGDDQSSYFYRLLCLNAGAAFCVAGKTPSIEEGIQVAEKLIASGEVSRKLEACRRVYAHYAQ